jgi:hypothetical protein
MVAAFSPVHITTPCFTRRGPPGELTTNASVKVRAPVGCKHLLGAAKLRDHIHPTAHAIIEPPVCRSVNPVTRYSPVILDSSVVH